MIISLHSINRQICLRGTECVHYAVRQGYLCVNRLNLVLHARRDSISFQFSLERDRGETAALPAATWPVLCYYRRRETSPQTELQ